jgi:hypothetical protein
MSPLGNLPCRCHGENYSCTCEDSDAPQTCGHYPNESSAFRTKQFETCVEVGFLVFLQNYFWSTTDASAVCSKNVKVSCR